MTREELCKTAVSAMKSAYAPYSDYKVGAALLCKDGTVFTGCNIENASYGLTCCAERTAFFKAIGEGKKEFTEIAVCGGKNGILESEIFPPCGACRQVMREFCEDDFIIDMVYEGGIKSCTLQEILPYSFKPERLK
ncbi:MAG: cytidine deaminase [Acutalibacteraceae bacterium]